MRRKINAQESIQLYKSANKYFNKGNNLEFEDNIMIEFFNEHVIVSNM